MKRKWIWSNWLFINWIYIISLLITSLFNHLYIPTSRLLDIFTITVCINFWGYTLKVLIDTLNWKHLIWSPHLWTMFVFISKRGIFKFDVKIRTCHEMAICTQFFIAIVLLCIVLHEILVWMYWLTRRSQM